MHLQVREDSRAAVEAAREGAAAFVAAAEAGAQRAQQAASEAHSAAQAASISAEQWKRRCCCGPILPCRAPARGAATCPAHALLHGLLSLCTPGQVRGLGGAHGGAAQRKATRERSRAA